MVIDGSLLLGVINMKTCENCQGAILEPNKSYGYAGKVCMCHLNIQAEMKKNLLDTFNTKCTQDLIDANVRLLVQVEANRKDAERYRFLREQALDNKGMGLVVFVEMNQLDHIHDSNAIDAAIDKAMAE